MFHCRPCNRACVRLLIESSLVNHSPSHICHDLIWFSHSGAQSDIKPETQQEPSEPVPSEPEQAEPVADMDTTTTEPTPKVNTGVNQPTPDDDTTKVDASSANDVIPDNATDTTVNLEGDAAVAPDADISALSDGGAENLPKAEEKSAGKPVVVPVLIIIIILNNRILILGLKY